MGLAVDLRRAGGRCSLLQNLVLIERFETGGSPVSGSYQLVENIRSRQALQYFLLSVWWRFRVDPVLQLYHQALIHLEQPHLWPVQVRDQGQHSGKGNG